MPLTDEQLRAALQLEQDADVNAEIRKLLEARTADPATKPTEPVAPAAVAPAAPVTPAAPAEPAAPVVDPALATLSADTRAQLQADSAYLARMRRDNALDDAIRTGRISPAERSLFAARMDQDEAFTTTLLAELAPRFAVSELGSATAEPALDKAAEDAWSKWETDGTFQS